MLLSTTVYSFTAFACLCFAIFEVPISSVFWYIYLSTSIAAFVAGFYCINDKNKVAHELLIFTLFWSPVLFCVGIKMMLGDEITSDYIVRVLTLLCIFALIGEWLYMRIKYLKMMKTEG